MKKNILYFLAVIVILLIITNPTQKAFQEFIGKRTATNIRRPFNFFLFSKYTYLKEDYIAIFGNFINVTPNDPFKAYGGHIIDSVVVDSTVRVDSAFAVDSTVRVDSSGH